MSQPRPRGRDYRLHDSVYLRHPVFTMSNELKHEKTRQTGALRLQNAEKYGHPAKGAHL